MKPNGFPSVHAFTVSVRNSPQIPEQLKMYSGTSWRGGRSHLHAPVSHKTVNFQPFLSVRESCTHWDKTLRLIVASIVVLLPNTVTTITTTLTLGVFRGCWFLQPMPEMKALGINAGWATSLNVLSAGHGIPLAAPAGHQLMVSPGAQRQLHLLLKKNLCKVPSSSNSPHVLGIGSISRIS